jgi:hypothetical protein
VVKAKIENIHQLNINGDLNYTFKTISDFLNNYLLSITRKNHSAIHQNNNNSVDYVHQNFNKTFPNIKYQYTSTRENEKIISSLK